MAFNYQINITAVNRAEEVFARIEKLFSTINGAMQKLEEATQRSEEASRRAGEAMQRVGDQAEEAGRKAFNMSNAIATGMLKAQVAVQAVSTAVNFLKGKFMEAAEIQLQNISASSTFASLTGKSYEEAAKFTDNFNIKISEAAASLPGSTAGYAQLARVIGDSVLPAFKDASGQLDIKGYEEGLFELVRSYGAVAAGGGIDIGNTALGLTKAFMGSSTAELRQIQVFEQNPVILNYIDEQLKKRGASKFADVSEADRLKILTEAAKQMITDDFIKRSSESVSGLMEGFNSAIFDPSTGLFGVFRDLNEEAEGSQTAFQSFNDLLVRILGQEGIFGQLQKFLEAMNLPDPMRVVKQALDFAVSVLDQVIRVMKDINILIDSGYNIIQIISYLFNGYFQEFTDFPDFIASTLDSILDALEGLVMNFDGEALGRHLADGIDAILSWIGGLFVGGITSINADRSSFIGRLGAIISEVVFQLFVALGSFFRNLDAGSWVAIASAALVAYLVPALVSSLAALLPGVLAAASITLAGGVPTLLMLAAIAAFTALGKVIWERKDQIASHMEPFFAPLINMFKILGQAFELMKAVLSGDIQGAQAAASAIIKTLQDLLVSIVNQFRAAYDTFVTLVNPILQMIGRNSLPTSGEQEARAVARSAEQRLATAQAVQVYGSVGGARWRGQIPDTIPAAPAVPAFDGLFSGSVGGARWRGQIPDTIPAAPAVPAFDGLFSALAAEAANMPPGAKLAIANTSEAILTPAMLRNLVSNTVAAGASMSGPVAAPSIQVNINGAQEPGAIAQQVIQQIERLLDEYMQGQLT